VREVLFFHRRREDLARRRVEIIFGLNEEHWRAGVLRGLQQALAQSR
jgi:hypothetical protein